MEAKEEENNDRKLLSYIEEQDECGWWESEETGKKITPRTRNYLRNLKEKALQEINERTIILAEGDIMKEGTQSDEIRAAKKIVDLLRYWGLKFDENEKRHLERSIIKENRREENKEAQLKILSEIRCVTITCKRNCHGRSKRLTKVNKKTEEETWGSRKNQD